jgi:hypothetical protein
MPNRSLALALLSSIAIATVLPASAVAKPPVPGRSGTAPDVQFCKDLAADGYLPWFSVGECISLNLSTSWELQNFWAHHCDNLRDEGWLEESGITYSECVHEYERY